MKYLRPCSATLLATAALVAELMLSGCTTSGNLSAQISASAPGAGESTGVAGPHYRFQFGAEKARPGFTVVAPQASYTVATGYGFEPGAAAAGQPFAFSVTVPEGNYRVTVTLGDPAAAANTTVKAEARRLMLESIQTGAGEYTTRSFTVNVRRPEISTGGRVNLDSREWDAAANRSVSLGWDDKLTLTFSGAHPAVASLEIEKTKPVVTLFILGDSTVTDQSRGPGSSWGQMIPRWFQPAVAVANHAESGETLKGFLKERRWDKVLDSVKPGDYVLIEFGTNDSKNHGPQNMYPNQDFAETYAPAATTYRELLRRFVADAKNKGAIPIIASPSARRGEVRSRSSLGAYAAAAMATAKELGVAGIDLNAMGIELNVALGAEAGRQFNDGTHHVEYGSYLQAKCIVEGIKQSGLGLAKYIVDDFGDFDPNHPEPTPAHFTLPPDPASRRQADRPVRSAAPAGP
jgi:lysophospholipase L1-like esterase